MPAFRPVVFIGGLLTIVIAAAMTIPALVELGLGADHAFEYLPCIAVAAFLGGGAMLVFAYLVVAPSAVSLSRLPAAS